MAVGFAVVKWPLLRDAATTDVAVNCSLVVVILAVAPWRYASQHYLHAEGNNGDDGLLDRRDDL